MADVVPGPGNSRAVNKAMVAGMGGKLAMTVLNLLIVAIAVRSLGVSAFGVVAVLTGLVNVLGFLDLGIGNSTISSISSHLAKSDTDAARLDVANALTVLGGIGLLISMGGPLLAAFIPNSLLFDAPGVTEGDLRASLAVFFISVGTAIPGTMGSRICLARQLGATNNVYLVAGTALSLVCVGICAIADAPVWVFVVATMLVPNILLALQTVVYTTTSRYAVTPAWRSVTRKSLLSIGHASFYYMVLGACSAISFQTNSLVVAYALDSTAAGILGIATRLYSLVTSLFLGGLQQSWASSSRAIAAGHMSWVRKNFWHVFRITTVPVLVMSAGVTVFGRQIVDVWAGAASVPPISLLVVLAIWTCYSFVMTQLSFLLNAANIVRRQAIVGVVMLVAVIPLSIYLTVQLGIIGSTLASLIAHVCIVGVPFVIWTRTLLRTSDADVVTAADRTTT